MKSRFVLSMFLALSCFSCGTMRHQIRATSPHATIETTRYNYHLVDDVWCDGKQLSFTSGKPYRITVGRHELKTRRRKPKAQLERSLSELETVLLPIAVAATVAGVVMIPGASLNGGFSTMTSSKGKYEIYTITFTVEPGVVYVTDGLAIWVK